MAHFIRPHYLAYEAVIHEPDGSKTPVCDLHTPGRKNKEMLRKRWGEKRGQRRRKLYSTDEDRGRSTAEHVQTHNQGTPQHHQPRPKLTTDRKDEG